MTLPLPAPFDALDDYEFRHLIEDLDDIADEHNLHRVLGFEGDDGGNEWSRARERRSETSSYLGDLMRGWNRADDAARRRRGANRNFALAMQCRYACMTAGFNDFATGIRPELAARLVQSGRWTQEQALAYASRTHPDARLAVLADALRTATGEDREQLARDALAAARSVAENVERVEAAVVSLVENLPSEWLGEVVALVRDMAEPRNQSKALEAIAPRVSDSLLEETLAVAEGLGDSDSKVDALTAFLDRLSHSDADRIFDLAVEAARTARDPMAAFVRVAQRAPMRLISGLVTTTETVAEASTSRKEVIVAVIGRFAERDPRNARETLRGLDGSAAVGQALEATALAFARQGSFDEALETAQAVSEFGRDSVLSALPDCMPPKYWRRLLEIMAQLPGQFRAKPLAALARMSDAHFAPLVVQVADDIPDSMSRTDALTQVAAALPGESCDDAVHRAFLAACTDSDWSLTQLNRIASRLPLTLALDGLEKVGRWIESGDVMRTSANTFGLLAARVATLGELDTAVNAIRCLTEEEARSAALAGMALEAPDALIDRIFLAVAPPRRRGARLHMAAALAPYLPEALVREALHEAEEFSESGQVELILQISRSLPEATRACALGRALDALPDYENRYPGIFHETWERILGAITPRDVEEAVPSVRLVHNPRDRISMLTSLAERAEGTVRERTWMSVLDGAFRLRVKDGKLQSLVRIAPLVPPQQQAEFLNRVAAVSEGARSAVLQATTDNLTQPERLRAIDMAHAMTSQQLRLATLGALLKEADPPTRQDAITRAMEMLDRDPDSYENGWVFGAVVHLALYDDGTTRLGEWHENAVGWADGRQTDVERAQALAMLAGRLNEPLAGEARTKALDAAASVDDKDFGAVVQAFALFVQPDWYEPVVVGAEERLARLHLREDDEASAWAGDIGRAFTLVAQKAAAAERQDLAMRAVALTPESERHHALAQIVALVPVKHLRTAATLSDNLDVRTEISTLLARAHRWPDALEVLDEVLNRYRHASASWEHPGVLIARLAEAAPRRLIAGLRNRCHQLRDAEQAYALSSIVRRLSREQRRDELERALNSEDTGLLTAIAPHAASALPLQSLLNAWRRGLRRASQHGRQATYAYIAAIGPVIAQRCDGSAPGTYSSVLDAERWWARPRA